MRRIGYSDRESLKFTRHVITSDPINDVRRTTFVWHSLSLSLLFSFIYITLNPSHERLAQKSALGIQISCSRDSKSSHTLYTKTPPVPGKFTSLSFAHLSLYIGGGASSCSSSFLLLSPRCLKRLAHLMGRVIATAMSLAKIWCLGGRYALYLPHTLLCIHYYGYIITARGPWLLLDLQLASPLFRLIGVLR